VHFASSCDDLQTVDLSTFRRPVAVEWIDVADDDGLCRKYRYQASGEIGTPQHLQVSDDWITRGCGRIKNERTKAEEIAYLTQPDPNRALFQEARRRLQLEFVAFDYGYDQWGQPVVWEANPFPFIHFSTRRRGPLKYRNFAIHASLRALLLSYYDQAGLPRPLQLTNAREDRLPHNPYVWKRPYYRLREWTGASRRRVIKSLKRRERTA
jgi:hypothetical protein